MRNWKLLLHARMGAYISNFAKEKDNHAEILCEKSTLQPLVDGAYLLILYEQSFTIEASICFRCSLRDKNPSIVWFFVIYDCNNSFDSTFICLSTSNHQLVCKVLLDWLYGY